MGNPSENARYGQEKESVLQLITLVPSKAKYLYECSPNKGSSKEPRCSSQNLILIGEECNSAYLIFMVHTKNRKDEANLSTSTTIMI